ncbi:rSAM-modified peptide [Hymenobacter lutimineralis]|uniref:RSAM-modified peptide n=1 Tax=Hymenobacter lutimineralis TaxID=2606448 RepID=A0A5D6VBI1_9BACT|nr:class I lanthipeptide [Hymenobacter lutimineralis]TYZ12657.1 rSAM-modified peptide [Hymenobacter lutimineralis]
MKKIQTKLSLNKQTIASLDKQDMATIKGGFTYALSTGQRCQDSRQMMMDCRTLEIVKD